MADKTNPPGSVQAWARLILELDTNESEQKISFILIDEQHNPFPFTINQWDLVRFKWKYHSRYFRLLTGSVSSFLGY